MSEQIQTEPSVPNYRIGTSLSGKVYLLDFRWNARAEAWFMDVLQEDETLVRAGLKLVLGVIIGGRETDPDFPAGYFMLSDLAGGGEEATLDSLGDRHQLYYFEPGE